MDKYDLEVSTDESIQIDEMEKVVNNVKLQDALTLEYTEENTVSAKTDYNKMEIVERLYMLTRLEHSIERCEKEGVYSDEEVTAHFQNRRIELPA